MCTRVHTYIHNCITYRPVDRLGDNKVSRPIKYQFVAHSQQRNNRQQQTNAMYMGRETIDEANSNSAGAYNGV